MRVNIKIIILMKKGSGSGTCYNLVCLEQGHGKIAALLVLIFLHSAYFSDDLVKVQGDY